MSLSIITPHYNDFEGLQKLYNCLQVQTNSNFEWIIVDDFSDKNVLVKIKKWHKNLCDDSVQIIYNAQKSNASVCRNIGANEARFDNLIFLDADDSISQDFVLNRDITFVEFAVFKNTAIVDRNGTQERRPSLKDNYLNYFLSAKFIWQTTAILWKKSFFVEIGKFDPNLERLQDVELSIRALFVGKDYKIVDNRVDFFYRTKPIRLKKNIVRKSCASVNYLISKIHTNYTLDLNRQSLLKAYYFACVKGLQRCKNRKDVVYVKESLKVFFKKKYINGYEYVIGITLLKLYRYQLISDSLFIRINRYFFKKHYGIEHYSKIKNA
jgi:glycosyltransferase involved in cell wall biosynthesis